MEKINTTKAQKTVKVHVNGAAAAAFAKDTPQMYAKSEVVVDSQFINEVVAT